MHKVKFKSDPANSKFRWVFHFTPGMPGNSVTTMDGYSKGQGAENSNDRVLLIKKLQNPLLPKFKNCDMIEVFINDFSMPKEKHDRVLVLYPHTFELYGEYQDDQYITNYLEKFYQEFLETGKMEAPEPAQMPITRAALQGELNHSIRFKTHQELSNYLRKYNQKYGESFMKAWYWKHLEIQPELRTQGKRVDFSTGKPQERTF